MGLLLGRAQAQGWEQGLKWMRAQERGQGLVVVPVKLLGQLVLVLVLPLG